MYFLKKVGYNRRVIHIYTQGIVKMNVRDFLSKLLKVRKSSAVASQSGFTLLEMLVVIAVVGVLAAIAVPRFQNSLQRATFVEAVNAASPYRAGVEMCLQRGNPLAQCNAGANGVPPAVGASVSGVVNNVNVVGGLITVTAGANIGDGAVNFTLTPAVNNGLGANSITWAVGGTCLQQNLCN
jgi:type IV pilus assembly protein PilA